MDIKIGVGLFVAIIVGVAIMIPVTNDVIASAAVYGTSTEYWNGTALTPHTGSYIPIYSFTSLYRSNVSTASNLVATAGMNVTKSFATTAPSTYTGANANLTVICDYADDETIAVSFGAHPLGDITACPATFTNVSHSWLGDPATTVTFVNGGSDLVETAFNDSESFLLNDSLEVYVYTTNHLLNIGETLNFTVDATNPNGDMTEIRLNGHVIEANFTGASISGVSIPNAYLNLSGEQLFYFTDLNGTDFDGSTIDNVSISFDYHDTVSNFTNATISYYGWRADTPNATNFAAGTVTPATTGTYRTIYVYGQAMSETTQLILSLVPVFLVLLVIAIVAMGLGVMKF